MTSQTMVFGLFLGYAIGATVHHVVGKRVRETFKGNVTRAALDATGHPHRWMAALFLGLPFVLLEWACAAALAIGAVWRFAGWVSR